MAAIEAKVIQELLDQVTALRKAIQTAGNEGRTKLEAINIDQGLRAIPLAEGKLDTQRWTALPDEKGADGAEGKKEVHDRLVQLRDSLRDAAGLDGPADPKHIMHEAYASTPTIVIGTLTSFGLVLGLLWGIVSNWDRATNTDFAFRLGEARGAVARLDTADSLEKNADAALGKAQRSAEAAVNDSGRRSAQLAVAARTHEAEASREQTERARAEAAPVAIAAIRAIEKGGATEKIVLLMVTLLGALGGSVHLVASLVKYVGNRQLKRSWLLYYLSLPFVGGALAPIVYMLLRVGILTPSGVGQAGSGTAALNLIGIYAFGALTGMFAKPAADKLKEVFETIFTRSATKDALGPEKAPGVVPAGPKTP